jgi:hypothetical protein
VFAGAGRLNHRLFASTASIFGTVRRDHPKLRRTLIKGGRPTEAMTDPIAPHDVRAIDGDTIRIFNMKSDVRLEFNAPAEPGISFWMLEERVRGVRAEVDRTADAAVQAQKADGSQNAR